MQDIVALIRSNNPGRPITPSRVMGFPSRTEANSYELAHPQSVLGGLFFQFDAGGNLAYVLQTNSTVAKAMCCAVRGACLHPVAGSVWTASR